MAQHNILGRQGEELAARYLQQKGYQIIDRNWRSGRQELDIVAQKEDILVFVEVKSRRNNRFGDPQEAVSDTKIRNLVTSAEAYVCQHEIDLPVRFDIITVVGEHEPFTIHHIEEAFYPPLWS